ncbi:MAG TPA: OB-fold nucleic acid binding domain-containing protein, partial [Candidatus Deferrimicrobium sp.]|nr:OB-fold nucleic acid binding domain-containing protein [Candidatus Deferrimicrobium sp.]
ARKFAVVEDMLEFGRRVSETAATHDLFVAAGKAVSRTPPDLPTVEEWPSAKKLAEEKAMLGFYISGHPLDKFRDELQSFTTARAAQLADISDGREVTIGGIITAVKEMIDKKGNTMAFVTLEDYSGGVELILFSDCYARSRSFVGVDRMVLVGGRVSTREGEATKIIGTEVVPLEKLTERFNCQLVIKIDMGCSDTVVDRALASLEEFPGQTPVLLAARDNGTEVFIKSRKYSVNLDLKLVSRLKELLGESGVYFRPLTKREPQA